MTPDESWRPVVGFEDLYEVSSLGRVRSLDRVVFEVGGKTRLHRGRVLSQARANYAKVNLKPGDGTQTLANVHRLVAEAFLGHPPPGGEVCHNNGDRWDNRVSNLRWDTHAANIADLVASGNHSQARKTECKNGHPFTPANTRHQAGKRRCRQCECERARIRRRRSKESRLAASD